MPTYVYKFVETGETVEIQQSFSDPTLTEAVHPRTGVTMAVRKVFQPVGVTFKGDGFYKTDSRSTSKVGSGAGSKSDGHASSDSGSTTGGSGASDAKSGATGSDAAGSKPAASTPSTGGSSGAG